MSVLVSKTCFHLSINCTASDTYLLKEQRKTDGVAKYRNVFIEGRNFHKATAPETLSSLNIFNTNSYLND